MKHRTKALDGQIRIQYEIIVDSFAGGGGASTGIELATGKPVDAAINHDPAAVIMHKTNHRFTEHVQASVWDVDPTELCRGRPVGLLWASPDCTSHSKAKGGQPRDADSRTLAEHLFRYIESLTPDYIQIENVEEFMSWGDMDENGKPLSFKEIEGSLKTLKADYVFIAMGFLGVDANSFVKDINLEVDKRGRVESLASQGIFTCGDMRTGQSLVVRAMADAKNIAKNVDEYLKGL